MVVVSDFVRRQIEQFGFKLKNPVAVPVGVAIDKFANLSVQVMRRDLQPYIISVGMIKYRKGYHLSIPAFSLVCRTRQDLRYVIVGKKEDNDGYYLKLLNLAEQHGVASKIIWLQDLSDAELADYYAGAELFLLAPVSENQAIEGFGMVFLEANMSGLAVIGTTNSGAEAAIRDGYNGLLVEPNPEALAMAIEKLLNDQALRSLLAEQGKLHAREFSWDKIARRYIDIYKNLANSNVRITKKN